MRSIGYLLTEGFRSLWKNRTMSIASVAVLVSCLLLTGIAALITVNMDIMMKEIESDNTITIYLEDTTPQLISIEIGEAIRSLDNISSCEYVASDDALDYVMDSMGGDADVLDGLGEFLPDAYTISMYDLSLYNETIELITTIDGVDKYSDYSEIADMLTTLDEFVTIASIVIIVILAIISLFIISNTVKVTMFSRRVEINIMKSVGATNKFIRVPFFVEGVLIGLISGGISCSVLYFAYAQISVIITDFISFITVIDIVPYTTEIFISYAILGSLFGILGGVISIGRYLKKEGENAIM